LHPALELAKNRSMWNRTFAAALLALTLVACGGSDDAGGGQSGGTVTSGGESPVLDVTRPLAQLMGGEMVIAARADVAHIRASSLYPRMTAFIQTSNPSAEESAFTIALLERTEEMALAAGQAPAGEDPHLTLFRGQYSQEDFDHFASLRSDAVPSDHRGAHIFSAGGESLTLVGGRLFVFGTTSLVHEAIDRLAGSANAPSGVAARLLDDPALAGAPIAVALMAYDALRAKISESSNAPRELRSLVGGSAVVNLSAGFAATALLDVGSDAAATGLQSRLRSELSSPAVRLGMSAMGLSGLASAIRFSASGTTTRVDVTLDASMLEQLVSVLEGFFQQYVEDSN
jgi:hypothetical protein